MDNNIGIMVGHHKGDVQENIISNMMKGCSLFNLNGMFKVSCINTILIWRPFLENNKKSIFNFSHKFGVPYFKDTTPKWSTRRKMRNQLLPLLDNMYGNGFLNNLSLLRNQSIQFKNIAIKYIFKPFYDKIKFSNLAVWVNFDAFQNNDIFFWKKCFKYMTEHVIGIPKIHEKAIKRQLLTKIRGNKRNDGWLQLRR